MVFGDGSKYIGEWHRGIMHGFGKFVFPDHTVKEGYFENNAFVGTLSPKKQTDLNKSSTLLI